MNPTERPLAPVPDESAVAVKRRPRRRTLRDTQADLLSVIADVSIDDMAAIWRNIIQAAKGGNQTAQQMFLDRVLGKASVGQMNTLMDTGAAEAIREAKLSPEDMLKLYMISEKMRGSGFDEGLVLDVPAIVEEVKQEKTDADSEQLAS